MLNVRYTKQMKRIFVLFSIILLLGSNIVMALDYDCVPIPQQQSTFDQNTDPTGDVSFDDCCHSAAHFVGIYPDISYTTSIVGNRYIRLPFELTASQTYQPATPPPNV